MSRTEVSVPGGGLGMGLTSLLGVLFIAFKMTGVISWPWLWVLAPFWLSTALGMLLLLGMFVYLILKSN